MNVLSAVKSNGRWSSSKYGLDKTGLMILLLLIPFFEPLCFFYLKDCLGYESVGSFFDLLFMVYRMASVCLIFILFAMKTRFALSLVMIVLMGFFSCLSVAIMNSSGLIKAIYEALTILALGMLLHHEWKTNPDELISACTILFLAFSTLSLASVLLTGANGIASAQAGSQAAKDAIFFFGGKNSIFIYNLPTMLFLSFYEYRKRGKVGFAPAVISFLFCIASVQIDSASSTFFFFVLTAFCLFVHFVGDGVFVRLISQPILLLAVFLFIFVFIVLMGGQHEILTDTLGFFGRSSTFSGRAGIWQEALSDIAGSPFFGGGGSLMFKAGATLTPHAHSFYLNAFAQYGIFYFVVFMLDIIIVAILARKENLAGADRLLVSISSFFFFMLILHSVFDFLSLPLYFLLRSCIIDANDFYKSVAVQKEQAS